MAEELIKKSNTLGSKPMVQAGVTTAAFCMATVGDVVVKTPNRWVTIFKGGKLQVDDQTQVFRVSSEDDIKGDGVWLVDTEDGRTVYVEADGVRMLLASSSDGFLSYTAEQELTPDQITRAVLNVGLYFATLEEAQSKGLNDGLVYVTDTGTLYKVSGGVFTDVITSAVDAELDRRTEESSTTLRIGGIYIDGDSNAVSADGSLTIQVDGVDYVTLRGGTVYVNRSVVFGSSVTIGDVSTSGARSGESGLLVYSGSDGVTLEVDNLVVHNGLESDDEGPLMVGDVVWSPCMNLIRSAEWADAPQRIKVKYKYDNGFKAGDVVRVCLGAGVNWAEVSDMLRDGVRYMCVQLDEAPQESVDITVNYTAVVDGEDASQPRSVVVTVDPTDGWDEEEPDDYNSYGEAEIPDEEVDEVVSISVDPAGTNIRLKTGSDDDDDDDDDGGSGSYDAVPMVTSQVEAVVEAGEDGAADVLYVEGNASSAQSVLDSLKWTPVSRVYDSEEGMRGLYVEADDWGGGRLRVVMSESDGDGGALETELLSVDPYMGVVVGAPARYDEDMEWGDVDDDSVDWGSVIPDVSIVRRLVEEAVAEVRAEVEALREELVERGIL